MPHNTQGQATIFIIIGALLLLVIILVVYLAANNNDLQEEQAQATLSQQAMKPVNNYITRCLDFVVDDALDKISIQGFALYTSQGGTIADSTPSLLFDNTKTAYRITLQPENTQEHEGKILVSNSLTVEETYDDTTLLVYPWATYPYHPTTGETTRTGNAAYGWNTLPPLQRTGPNSVEEQLERYIATNIENCADFTTFPEFSFTTEQPRAEAVFTPTNTIVTLHWNINLQDNKGRTGGTNTFIATRSIRMLPLYNYVKHLIDQDVSNITFAIQQDHEVFNTFIEEDYTNATLIRVIDPQSNLNGKPYEIRFGRENRPPALDLINQTLISTYNLNSCSGVQVLLEDTTNTLRIHQHESTCTIDIQEQLTALDPDEDDVSFSVEAPPGNTMPHTLSSGIVSSPLIPCIPYTITASDGNRTDHQTIRLRLRSPTVSCT